MTDNLTNYTLGAGAGYLSYKGVKKLGMEIKKPYSSTVMRNFSVFSKAESEALKKATYDGFIQAGLKTKKYYLHDVKPEDVDNMVKLMKKKSFFVARKSKFFRTLNKLKKNKNVRPFNQQEQEELLKKITEHLKNNEYKKAWQEYKTIFRGKPINPATVSNKIFKSDKPTIKLTEKLKVVSKGKNAFCSPLTKDIMINMDNLGGASFHEMGHALNASGSKALKALVFGRHITKFFVPVILAVGLFKSKKKEGQEPNGIIDKMTTFIKNNAGKLTFAALIPTLAEEGLASVRGLKHAAKHLPAKTIKNLARNYATAWSTYAGTAAIIAGGVALGIKVANHIKEGKKAQQA
jgi:hypothetical protein